MINLWLKYIGAFICVQLLVRGIVSYQREVDRGEGWHLLWWGLFAFTGAVIALGGERFVQAGMPSIVHVGYNATLNVFILGMVYHGVGITVSITGYTYAKCVAASCSWLLRRYVRGLATVSARQCQGSRFGTIRALR